MGTPTFESPLHYDSGDADSAGVHFDLFYNPGVGNTHTLMSIVVTRDVGCPRTQIVIGKPDGSQWTSPVVPKGQRTFTQAQINAQGFVVIEDTVSFTVA